MTRSVIAFQRFMLSDPKSPDPSRFSWKGLAHETIVYIEMPITR